MKPALLILFLSLVINLFDQPEVNGSSHFPNASVNSREMLPIRIALQLDNKVIKITDHGSSVNLGLVYKDLGLYEKSIDHFKKSIQTKKKLADANGEAYELNNLAQAYYKMGDYQAALENYERALAIFSRVQKTEAQAELLNNIGDIYDILGNYEAAFKHYRLSLDKLKSPPNLKDEATVLSNMARLHRKLGMTQEALECFESALSKFRKLGDPADESDCLMEIATTWELAGRADQAEKTAREALEVVERAGQKPGDLPDILISYYIDSNKVTEAQRFIQKYSTPLGSGKLDLANKNFPSALSFFLKLSEFASKSDNAKFLFASYIGLGKSYEGLKQYTQAEEFYAKAIELAEELRLELAPSDRSNFYMSKICGFAPVEAFKGLTGVIIKAGDPERSLEAAEDFRAKLFASGFWGPLSAGSVNIPQRVINKEQALLNRLAAFRTELAQTDSKTQGSKFDVLSKEIKTTTAEINSLKEELWKKYPTYASVKYPKSFKLGGASIRPDDHSIFLDVLDGGIAVWVVNDKKIQKNWFIKFSTNESELLSNPFRAVLAKNKPDDRVLETASLLYEKILLSVMQDVPKERRLTIISGDALAKMSLKKLATKTNRTNEKDVSNRSDVGDHDTSNVFFLSNSQSPLSFYESISALEFARDTQKK
ncbi:MAG: tetratricopeptide repeat protein [Desulfomonilaceae bacterium]